MNQSQQLVVPADVNKAVMDAQAPFREIIKQTPGFVNWESEEQFALQILARNPFLYNCDKTSIRDAVISVAAIGLSLNPKLQHCALIPRYNSTLKRMECCADPMYQGLLKLATDGGKVLNVDAGIVYEDEIDEGRFKMTRGSAPTLHHEPDVRKHRSGWTDVVGAYVVAEIRDSHVPKITFVPVDDLKKAMEASEMVKRAREKDKPITGPWADWPEEMMIKTALKRAQKTWPKGSGRLETAIHYANIAEGYIEPHPDDIPGDAEVVKTVTEEQAKELRSMCRAIGLKVEKIYEAFEISKMELLPVELFDDVKTRILTRGLVAALKKAGPEDEFYASDFGITYAQLEGYGAEAQTKAKLFTKRK